MKPTIRVSSLSLPLLALAGLMWSASSVISEAPTAFVADKEPPKADPAEAIKPPDGQVVLFKLKAEGVQIYECKVVNPNTPRLTYQWVLKAPAADLLDDGGKKVGKHGKNDAGPWWEDESGKVIGTLPPMGVAPKEKAIPWLLLKAKETEGKGMFAKVAYIQRVDTVGGVAPKQCDESYVGTELHVPYKATYVFYGAKP
jgi:hypothetical protein